MFSAVDLKLLFGYFLKQQLNKNQSEDEHELRMLVHQGHAGKIIGKSGNTIKELREV